MPRKVFTAGEVLAAADVNEFLMDQTIMTFAGTAARGSAIGTAVEGMYAHLNDTDTLTYYNGSAWVNRIGAPAGILQVVSVTKVDTFTTSSTSFTDVTGLTASITPTSTSSKILVLSKVAINTRSLAIGDIQLLRGATVIGGGTAAGSRVSGMSAFYAEAAGTTDLSTNFLDSPASVSSQTYQIQARTNTGVLGINTSADDANVALIARTSSTITLMEIAG
jgi:hypothetical protein